ncbi:Flp pilus assembly protein TadB [Variovorax sp. PBS-H4]|uniref:type II secretion system F family protein n=1 Tax=Variovorax sp. PBS-H4 TaxID=434008 RepID=UPI0013182C3D|nr:type II secretion system F family protein [Variovorax sp. PBS-H4]VTU26449.1 Flp pilus assembly protein TadB [Variovorax sp. PBS-H4]
MPPSIAGNSFIMIAVLVFVAVLLLLEGLYLMWKSYKGPGARQLERRLQALSGSRDATQQTKILKERMLSEVPMLQRWLQRVPRARELDRLLLQSGLAWTVSKLLLGSAALAVVAFAVVVRVAHQPEVFGLVAGVAFALVPLAYVVRCRSRRLQRLELQLPDALDLLTRALRSGHAFSSGLQMIGEEMADPIAAEFRIVHDEVNFGVSLTQALTNLSERIPITDLRYFVVAVLIQRDSGGNLTEVLGNLSRLIRERLKLHAKVRVLSADGRLSGWIIGLLPFALAGGLNLLNPKFMSSLWTDPIGITIVKYMLVMMAIGALILRHIVRIRV